MTLTVPFDQFAAAVTARCGTKEAFVTPAGRNTLVTAAGNGIIVATRIRGNTSLTKEKLEEQGLTVLAGCWLEGSAEESAGEPLYLAGVAYRGSDDKPGLWLDAFEGEVSSIQVLRTMYDEFVESGDLAEDLPFDEFIRRANANIVVLSPSQQEEFAKRKRHR